MPFRFLTLALSVILTACAGGSTPSTVSSPLPRATIMPSTVRGTVSYRERIAMPPGAVLEVSLVDVSRADASATVVGDVVLDNPGNVPVAFEIPYDASAIDQRRSYTVRARILVDGQPRWVSATQNPVLTQGNDNQVDIMLSATGGAAGGGAEAGANAALTSARWNLTHLGDQQVVATNPQRQPYLMFMAENRVGGSGGCNHIGGTYAVDGSGLTLSGIVSTMMACVDGMETETAFLRALEQVRAWRTEGARLELLDAAGAPVARFEAGQPD
ncbi:MAG TPA: YbaY family lipoprotein [Gemmatimonadota bacterium]|nr:YbaY family lipoprotein [Gemmatimonadota bacterium]